VFNKIFTGLLLWDASEMNAAIINKANNNITWPINYAALVKYGEEYGSCNIPQDKSYECILPGMGENGSDYEYKGKLGKWLSTQRRAKQGKGTCVIGPEREAKLQILVDKGKFK
jgi:hypothetical protein